MNCIFTCVFAQDKYVDMFLMLLESLINYTTFSETEILVYTSTKFMNRIKFSKFYNNKIKFEINDTYDSIDKACKARIDLFELTSIKNYSKILYLDTDILVKGNLMKLFNICKDEILYTLEEGLVGGRENYHGRALFGDEISKYENRMAFTSGILLFKNCEKIRWLFSKIKEDVTKRPNEAQYDQPFFVHNAVKYELYDNQILKKYAVNNDLDIHKGYLIYHFAGGPGIYTRKIVVMDKFLNDMKDYSKFLDIKNKIFIEELSLSADTTLVFLYKKCIPFTYGCGCFVEYGDSKGGCLGVMKYASGSRNRLIGIGHDNGTIEKTFKKLNLSMNNVLTYKNLEEARNINSIAVLRINSQSSKSVKICLESLYEKIMYGGIILISNYGVSEVKTVIDDFIRNNGITSNPSELDCSEYYFIKSNEITHIKTVSIHEDISTISNEMRYEIYDFFKDKRHFKIIEVGCHKGYTTKILSKIFSKVYAIDYVVEEIKISNKLHGNLSNVEYIVMDVHRNDWKALPEDMDVVFLHVSTDYQNCLNDIKNSIQRFKSLKYIVVGNYGVYDGVRKAVGEMIGNGALFFERFIGLNDIPSFREIVRDTNEGIICRVKS